MTGGHTRWSIHGIWRDQRHLLRLQRGQPVMYMNVDDAKARDLNDHDYVRVYNDVGSFHIHVKPTPALQPGQVVIYHAWENHQFKDWMQSQEAVPSPWKPQHIAGGYGHLHYRMFALRAEPRAARHDGGGGAGVAGRRRTWPTELPCDHLYGELASIPSYRSVGSVAWRTPTGAAGPDATSCARAVRRR